MASRNVSNGFTVAGRSVIVEFVVLVKDTVIIIILRIFKLLHS
jgi:hypothetical protein